MELLIVPLLFGSLLAEDKLYFSKTNKGPHVVRHSFFSNKFRIGYRLKLFCEAQGHPLPSISWYKGGKEVAAEHRTTIFEERFSSHIASRLQIDLTRVTDAGEYECVAANDKGANLRKFKAFYALR